jgi:hypothetical protein
MIERMKRILVALSPILFVVALWIFATQNSDRLPDPVAIHWGITGAPDGFASLESQLTLSSAVLALVGLLWAGIVFINRIPKTVKVLFLAIVGSLWVLLFFVFSYSLVIQIDLQDARQANLSVGVLLAILLIPLSLVPWMLAKPKIEVGNRFKVRYWGIPLLNLDYSEIVSASVGEVRAGDFGGWGIRYANKTTAFMPSSGPALELKLQAGERILVRTNQATELVGEIEKAKGSR